MRLVFLARAGVLSLAATCSWSCSDVEPAPPRRAEPVPAETVSLSEPEPTPEQERALRNPLHIAHNDYEPEPGEDEIKCRACHSVEGRERPPMKPRCLGCHEDSESAVHAQISNEDAKRCLTCHDFEHETADPWACAFCHTKAVASRRSPRDFRKAPKVSVHSEEACGTCHLPHGDEGPLDVGPCVECHEESVVRHHAELSDPEQCLECHGGHERASAAAGECARCHDEVSSSASFRGHECASCHEPHERPPVNECETCHAEIIDVLDVSVAEHQTCTSCHQPHAVAAGHLACTSCHSGASFPKRNSGRPAPIEGHRSCVDCHTQAAHAPTRQPTPCGQCHQPITRTMTQGHENCASCHEPHSGVSQEECSDCHAEKDRTGPHANTSTECGQCHRAHGPKGVAEPLGCVVCHDQVLPALHAIVEHQVCGDCHEFHTARDRYDRAGCLEPCHSEQFAHEPDARSCTGCHVFGGMQ